MISLAVAVALVSRKPERSLVVVPSPWATLAGLILCTLVACLVAGFAIAGDERTTPNPLSYVRHLWPFLAIPLAPLLLTRYVVISREHITTYTAVALVPVRRTSRSAETIYFHPDSTDDDDWYEPGPVVRFFRRAVACDVTIPCFRPDSLAYLLSDETTRVRGLAPASRKQPTDAEDGS